MDVLSQFSSRPSDEFVFALCAEPRAREPVARSAASAATTDAARSFTTLSLGLNYCRNAATRGDGAITQSSQERREAAEIDIDGSRANLCAPGRRLGDPRRGDRQGPDLAGRRPDDASGRRALDDLG